MSYFIFDTETTGFPIRKGFNNYFHPSLLGYYNSSRLIQIAYIIADENRKELYRKMFYIKPDNKFKIENSFVHGITEQLCEEKGKNIENVLEEIYEDIKKCSTIVAHNILFDINILLSECYRVNCTKLIEDISTKKQYCTMQYGKDHFSMPKTPRLVELYNLCTGKEWKQKHDAMDDVETCFKCFIILYK